MIIGVPKEVKDHEARVGVTPAGVKALSHAGHKVLVEHDAGEQSAFPDDEYQNAGAEIVGSAYNTWRLADMVVKVKEPVEKEYSHFREGLVLFTYLHLAPVPVLTEALLSRKVIGIAYETVRDKQGTLPLLTPMSEVAGRMSVQVGATYLQRGNGGRGILLGGVPGGYSGVESAQRRRCRCRSRSRHWRGARARDCGPENCYQGNGGENEEGRRSGGCCHRPGRLHRDCAWHVAQ